MQDLKIDGAGAITVVPSALLSRPEFHALAAVPAELELSLIHI